MNTWLTVTSAYQRVLVHRGRSALTVLGIVIGIVAVVLVVALGRGAQQLIVSEVEGFGARLIVIRPGREPAGPTDIAGTLLADSLTERDVVALRRPENVSGLALVEPTVLVPGAVTYHDQVFRPLVFGWTARALVDFYGVSPEVGSFFSDDDVERRARVAVIGWRVKEELFGEASALGEIVRVQNYAVRVVGVLPKRGQVSFLQVDELVLLPYTTAQRDILGISHYHEVLARAHDGVAVEGVAADIRATLRELHGISDLSKDDFNVSTQQDLLQRIGTVIQVLTIFLAMVASVALVVGGVGIMNVMLVSVTERTREIGLRVAVGATAGDIVRQFITEALVLTISGGIIGSLVAVTLSAVMALVIRQQFGLHWTWELPLGALFIGVGAATIIGLVFGFYPAWRAARMDPVDALRYE